MQSANQFGLKLPNSSSTQEQVPLNFYSENNEKSNNDATAKNNDTKEHIKLAENKTNTNHPKKDVDLRQLLSVLNPQVVSIAEKGLSISVLSTPKKQQL